MTNCNSLERRGLLRVNCHCLHYNTPLRFMSLAPPRQRYIKNTHHRRSSCLAAVKTRHRTTNSSYNEEKTTAGSSIAGCGSALAQTLLLRRLNGSRSLHQHTKSSRLRSELLDAQHQASFQAPITFSPSDTAAVQPQNSVRVVTAEGCAGLMLTGG